MKPSVEAFENAKLQAIGGLKLGKLTLDGVAVRRRRSGRVAADAMDGRA